MSPVLKAFPHGRPTLCALAGPVSGRASVPAFGRLPALVAVLAMVVVLVPLAGPAEAKRGPRNDRASRAAAAPAVVGQPRRNYVVPPTSYFSFPNRSKKERVAIRKRVLATIHSVWGGRRTSLGTPLPTNGTIRIATWSFDDWDMAKALVAAKKRGVSVQVVAAKGANKDHRAWRWLRKRLGQKLYRPGYPATREMYSYARACPGSCRGFGGTPHAKYFLFDRVGARQARNVVVQTSMNLTGMAYQGQWNQAQVMHSRRVYTDYMAIFRQVRLGKPVAQPYHVAAIGPVVNYFFPRPRATPAQDPVMQTLSAVSCTGATTGSGSGRTMIRVNQYAIYGERGAWIAKKLRSLWDAGCDVAIIYAVTSRPVLSILRKRTGRGAVPMRQSVVKDPYGNIVKYNHSKWMTITGHWGSLPAAYVTFSGSANWANLAFGDDEQMQRIVSRTEALRHLANFKKTWKQKTSNPPAFGRVMSFGRLMAPFPEDEADIPEEPVFGEGIYRYLPED